MDCIIDDQCHAENILIQLIIQAAKLGAKILDVEDNMGPVPDDLKIKLLAQYERIERLKCLLDKCRTYTS